MDARPRRELVACKTRSFFDNIRGFHHVPTQSPPPGHSNGVWVKYACSGEQLRCEASTQAFVHTQLAKSDEKTRRSIYVPEVFDFVQGEIEGIPYGIIVMEYVTGVPVSHIVRCIKRLEDEEPVVIAEKVEASEERVADVICFLLASRPSSPETAPASWAGGRWSDCEF